MHSCNSKLKLDRLGANYLGDNLYVVPRVQILEGTCLPIPPGIAAHAQMWPRPRASLTRHLRHNAAPARDNIYIDKRAAIYSSQQWLGGEVTIFGIIDYQW